MDEETKGKYSTISLPNKLLDEVDKLIDELGFWVSRSQFTREAVLDKLKKERWYWKP